MKVKVIDIFTSLVFFAIVELIYPYLTFPRSIILDICYNTNLANSTIGVYLVSFIYTLLICGFVSAFFASVHKKIFMHSVKIESLIPIILIIAVIFLIDIVSVFSHGFLGNMMMLEIIMMTIYRLLFVNFMINI